MSRSLKYTRHVDAPGMLPRSERETFIPDKCHHGRSDRLDLLSVTWTVDVTRNGSPTWEVCQYGALHEDHGFCNEIPWSAGIRSVESENGWPAGAEEPPEWFTAAAHAFIAEEAAKVTRNAR